MNIYLAGMSGPNETDNLKELIEPIHDKIEGIVWTVHLPKDGGSDYLESKKKKGKVSYLEFNYRNDFSRNCYLFNGALSNGYWFVNVDTMERLLPSFFEKIEDFYPKLEDNQIDAIFLHGKRFMFKYNDFLSHRGNPHETLVGFSRAIELVHVKEFSNSEEYFLNLRPQKRGEWAFINPFVKYYLSHPDSNHCLLGCENDMKEFERRETLRRRFRVYCQKVLRIELTWQGYLEYIKNNVLTDLDKEFLNNEVILNDFYKYHILEDRDLSHYKEKNQIIAI